MENRRRLWLKQIGLGIAGIGLANVKSYASPIMSEDFIDNIENHNNPTGTICEREALVEFVTKISQNTIVLIDEAYLDFTKQQSLSNIVNDHKNIIIAKTFSKIYGLAGARIGYAIASKTIIDNLSNLQSNTNNSVSVLSKLAAIASLNDNKFISSCYFLNENARQYTISELKKLNCECISSNTNFIYFSLAKYNKDYFKQLENNNIQGGRIYEEQGKWTRITVGKMDEMKKFIKVCLKPQLRQTAVGGSFLLYYFNKFFHFAHFTHCNPRPFTLLFIYSSPLNIIVF